MSHPALSHPPALVEVEVDVSRTSQDALDEAVSRALRLQCSLVLRHTTEIGWRAYGHHVLARAADHAHRRGLPRSLIVCRVVTRLDPDRSATRSPDLRDSTGLVRQAGGAPRCLPVDAS